MQKQRGQGKLKISVEERMIIIPRFCVLFSPNWIFKIKMNSGGDMQVGGQKRTEHKKHWNVA